MCSLGCGLFLSCQVWYLIVSFPDLCHLSNFMMSLSDDKQADIIDALNTASRYLDDI